MKFRRFWLLVPAALLFGGAAVPLRSQQAAKPQAAPLAQVHCVVDTTSTVDRIVAVVGTKPILASGLDEQLYTEFPGGKDIPTERPQVKAICRSLLEQMIDDELLVQEAQRDTTIKITDEEVTQAVDQIFQNARARYPSEEALRKDLQVSGFQTLEEWRSYQTDQQRRQFYRNEFRRKIEQGPKFKPIPPTDGELKEFFDQQKGRLNRPSDAVTFKQIVVGPRPTVAAKARARALADSILAEIRKGGDFATAAKRFSMDPGSKEQGGSLNWQRRGQGLDPKFEEAAFSLRPGQVSEPVETAFGYHLIQVERSTPADVQVRPILIMPVIDSVQADSARREATQAYEALKAGAAFDSMQRAHHDKAEEKEVPSFPVDQLPPAYQPHLKDAKPGMLIEPFVLPSPDPNRQKYVIVLFVDRQVAGEVKFEEVRDRLRRELGRLLAWRRQMEHLRHGNFVEIRDL
ncbi:MAG: peptidylprolyl isomerase [Gemmatimonadota bacterium]